MNTASTWIGILLCGTVLVAQGCLDEQRQGNAGDTCSRTVDCGPGLICVERQCVEAPAQQRVQTPDASIADATQTPEDRDTPTADLPPSPDVDGPDEGMDDTSTEDISFPDTPICEPGASDCQDNRTIRICRPDGQAFQTLLCANGTVCRSGQCVEETPCADLDGDGVSAGPGCPGQIDCNDDNPTVFPGAAELCDGLDNDCDGNSDESLSRTCRTRCGFGVELCLDAAWSICSAAVPVEERCNGVDDDCDGDIDEGVCDCCEPGSCGDQAVCVDCECREAPRDECLFQNQPCDSFQVGQSGDFFCADFIGGGDGLCLGLCTFNAPDPNATCPTDDAVCAFQLDDFQGLCLDGCDPSTGTGCFEGQGCLPLNTGGGCVPTGEQGLGDPCDVGQGPFGQCEAGAICIEFDSFRGTCERLCDPLAILEGQASSCTEEGTACFPLEGGEVGLCISSLGLEVGNSCRRFDQGRPCDDTSICEREDGAQFTCLQLCRLELGDEGCPGRQRCRRNDTTPGNAIGLCR